jgi:inner membrane transporter RhtA
MKAVLILISAMISIQYGASMAKGLFGVLTPEAVTSARITMAALILSLLFKPWRLKLSKKET